MLPVYLALTLLWQFDRRYVPAPEAFIITYIEGRQGQPGEMRTPPTAPGACGTGDGVDQDTYCTQWPTCPPEGEVIFFWAEAQWGAQRSAPSNTPAACHILAGCVCQMLAVQPPVEADDTLMPVPAGSPTPETPSPTPNLTPLPLPVFSPQYPAAGT